MLWNTTSDIVNDKSDLRRSKQNDVSKCHICWEPPTDPVATSCGHVFCWPCIYQLFLNGPKPSHCPVCRYILKADLDIRSLYSSGVRGADPSDGSPTESTATLDSIIPPRPNNPLVRGPASIESLAEEHRKDAGVDYITLQASARLASSQGFTLHITSGAVLSGNGRLIGELFAHVSNLETERADLQHRNNECYRIDLRQIIEAVDSKAEMCEQIISLQRQLDHANSLLPPGWNNDLS